MSRENKKMATYHGITKAICLNCGKTTKDDNQLEILNDLDSTCTVCGFNLVAWHTQGEIIVTAQENADSETTRYLIKGE
jgi:DNA-directed RNA polymerase subunit RPC12/RpoP